MDSQTKGKVMVSANKLMSYDLSNCLAIFLAKKKKTPKKHCF